MGVLIDTDLFIDRERGITHPAVEDAIGEEERGISVITMSELLHGVHRSEGATRTRRAAFVEYLLGIVAVIPVTERVARAHAQVWAQLTERGETIGAHDLWIAATALSLGLGVVTGNAREFSRVPGLRVLSP